MLLYPLRARWRPIVSWTAVAAVLLPPVVGSLLPCREAAAQEVVREARIIRSPLIRRDEANRAVLGIVMASGSRADTAGVTVESVEANGPAAKAGLKAGDVITAINGTSLRLTKEDAEDLALGGLAQRRLQRALAAVAPGADVSLTVRSGTQGTRTVAVKTVSAAELDRLTTGPTERRPLRLSADSSATRRGMVGLTIGSAGNARDTLGLFISAVTAGGPAEKAGVIEGERIASVNGVDVRVAKEDVDDPQAVASRVDRFVREVRKVEAGKTVALRVYGNGRYRDVTVTAAPSTEPSGVVGMSIGDGAMPRILELQRDGGIGTLRFDERELRLDTEQLRRSLEEMRRGLEQGLRGFEYRAPARARRTTVIL